ncbi:MAG: hypothetical protein Rsou_1469 [Candidatus Ruthia sp. Asou_11_S2]|nr:hypothetical protein [Candidatus Ruthia sp. Asou_11_S2]
MDISQLQQLSEQYANNPHLSELFDVKSIVVMLIFSTLGIVYYRKGKREDDFLTIACGLGLIFYGYFIDQFLYLIIVRLCLGTVPYLRRFL